MNKIGLGEHATPGSDPWRVALAAQRKIGKIIHADAEAVSLLFQEPAGSCGAKRVRSYFPRLFQPIFKLYDKGALPANLYDCPGIGVEVKKS